MQNLKELIELAMSLFLGGEKFLQYEEGKRAINRMKEIINNFNE
jgi:hypothetical protein